MTYSSGGTIQASDYNGFATSVNSIWSDYYGQTPVGAVSIGGTVTATQWASLAGTITNAYIHQSGSNPSVTSPSAGQTIATIANLTTAISTIGTNPYNAYAVGSQGPAIITGVNYKGTPFTTGQADWAIIFSSDVTFSNATVRNYFFNAGGIIRIQFSKTSTGTDRDPDWNAFATACGTLSFTSTSTSKVIAGYTYQGTNKIAGSGSPVNVATTIGNAQLTGTNEATQQELFLQYDGGAYIGSYIQVQAYNLSANVIRFTTTWYQPSVSGYGQTTNISGGTPPSFFTPGTAPCTIVSYFPPETTYLTNTWGTPSVFAQVFSSP